MSPSPKYARRRSLAFAGIAALALLLAMLRWRSDRTLSFSTSPEGATTSVGTRSTGKTSGSSGTHRASGSAAESQKDPRTAWRRATARQVGDLEAASSPGTEGRAWIESLFSNDGPAPIDPDSIQHWLDSGHTNAADLLALRQAGAGVEFLERALKEFPNDPQVLLAATVLQDGPEAHRLRLERLKAVDPDNALASYLSAWNEFKAGNREKALEELAGAAARTAFNDFVAESAGNAEKLLLDSGRSPAEAKALGTSSALLPHLSQLKQLSQNLAELQSQYLAAGDPAAAENLSRVGLRLGQQLMEGPGALTLISGLVGIAIEKNVLKNLDPNTAYDFLGGTPADYLAQLDQHRTQAKPASEVFESWIREAPEADILSYFTLFQTQGERAALQWLKERNPPSPVPPGPPR